MDEISSSRYTTPKPRPRPTERTVPVNAVENLLADKIKGMNSGIHRINLEDIADFDLVNVEKEPRNNKVNTAN